MTIPSSRLRGRAQRLLKPDRSVRSPDVPSSINMYAQARDLLFRIRVAAI